MSFSSPGFLFAFLPLVLLLLWSLPHGLRNLWLLLGSLAFYSIDGGIFTWVLLASILLNHLSALAIDREGGEGRRRAILGIAVVLNLAPLLYYKYWTFLTGIEQPWLPAGISFYTFQGISYVVDVYRREVRPASSLLDFGMYHTLFPQLIAGPIVRYAEVEDSITRRPVTMGEVEAGALRFCIGLAKKILIADSMGAVADGIFAQPAGELTMAAAWMGAICYSLQILFDFSGYSDMAIGLGRMLGFRFPENFDAPYRARSVTEFWRRWHMTLSRWFRDYVYIPLGGNRAGPVRTYVNLFIVFALCGLWHGAAWTFVLWGVFHGALLVIERIAKHVAPGFTVPDAISWPATMLLVMVGWVLFRAPSIGHAWEYLGVMAGIGGGGFEPWALMTPDRWLMLAIGCAIAVQSTRLPRFDLAAAALPLRAGARVAALGMLVLSSVMIAANGFNPFIYFRF